MKDLMIDLETLSTSPNAAVIQIGACLFDRSTGEIGDTFMCHVNPDIKSFDVSYYTIKWWMQQSDEARQSVFGNDGTETALACQVFTLWVDSVASSPDFRLWAMPTTFDVVILENMLRTMGHKVPWKYNVARDVRTVLELAGFGRENRVEPEIPHNALYDAIAQAKTLCNALKKIRNEGIV